METNCLSYIYEIVSTSQFFLHSKHLMLVFVPSQNQIRDVMLIEERHFVTTNPLFPLINKDIKKYIQKVRFRHRLA